MHEYETFRLGTSHPVRVQLYLGSDGSNICLL